MTDAFYSIHVHVLRESLGLSIAQAAQLVGLCSYEEWTEYESFRSNPSEKTLSTLFSLNNLRRELEHTYTERLKEKVIHDLPYFSNITHDNPLCFYLYRSVVKNMFLNQSESHPLNLITPREDARLDDFPELLQVNFCVGQSENQLQ
jgi:transcriptional regulator with XRE-family HTH domain